MPVGELVQRESIQPLTTAIVVKKKKDFIVYGSEKIYFLEFFSIMLLTWSGNAAIIIAFIIFIMMIS